MRLWIGRHKTLCVVTALLGILIIGCSWHLVSALLRLRESASRQGEGMVAFDDPGIMSGNQIFVEQSVLPAAQRFFLDHGHYPLDMHDLVPEYIAAWPDAGDPHLVWRYEADASAQSLIVGWAVREYSVSSRWCRITPATTIAEWEEETWLP